MGREVMQLQTTGMTKRSIDGTPILDQDGREQKVYENHHVETNARLFTGFEYSDRRGNVGELDRTKSRVDPMRLNVGYHDLSPKRDLNEGWIGDRVSDLVGVLLIILASHTPSHTYLFPFYSILHSSFHYFLLVSTLRGSSQKTLVEKGCQVQPAWKSLESSNAMEGPKS